MLACLREWKVDPTDERLNPNGSGISLGHPVGATGARILATMAHEMQRREAAATASRRCASAAARAWPRSSSGPSGMSAVEVAPRRAPAPTDAPVVVLSNSLGSTTAMWDAQADELAEHFRVVRYDTRGHGGSPVPQGPYDIDDLADDVVALLDALGVERAHFVGLSLGGMTGMRLAARNPDRVDRLVVLCTGARLEPSSAWHDRAATVRANGQRRGRGGRRRAVVHPGVPGAEPRREGRVRGIVAATPAEGYASCCEVIAEMDLRDDLPAHHRPDAGDRRRRRPGHPSPAPRGDRRLRAGRAPARRARVRRTSPTPSSRRPSPPRSSST